MISLITLLCISLPVIRGFREEYSTNGVLFNYEQTVLLAEKFVQSQFVVPFPQYDLGVEMYLRNISTALSYLWKHNNYGCNLNYTKTDEHNFTSLWMYTVVHEEHQRAQEDIRLLRA